MASILINDNNMINKLPDLVESEKIMKLLVKIIESMKSNKIIIL